MTFEEIQRELKKKVPLPVKKFFASLLFERPVKNYFGTRFEKNALLSYILHPFRQRRGYFTHTNCFEARTWARILNELGYNVDVVDYRSRRKIEIAKYDLICGFGEAFQRYFESGTSKRIKTIYYGTGMHVCHQNTASLKRVRDVYLKKGVWLGQSARFVEKTWMHGTSLVDGIIALGNEVCARSYRQYYGGPVIAVPAPFYRVKDGFEIIRQRKPGAEKHFLWFGSLGMIHKGLDLCLDFFSKRPDLNLHVCGPVEKEPDFVKIYHRELFECPNIRVYGFVDIRSEKFGELLKTCNFVIFPSCSEGGSPSLLTVIGNGALIPIISRETAVETGAQIWIEELSEKGLEEAVNKALELEESKIVELRKQNMEFVLQNHSEENYYKRLKSAIVRILELADGMQGL